MRRLENYIGREMLIHIFIVMAVLLSIYFFSFFLSELDLLTERYTLFEAFYYSVLLLPRQAYEIFPLTALIGTMLGMGVLASSSELTVMRAAGVSLKQLVMAVMKTGLILVVLVVIIGELVAPPLEKYARMERAELLARNILVNTDSEGLWARDETTYIHIERLLSEGQASHISLYRFDEQQHLVETVRADRAEFVDGNWILEQPSSSLISEQGVEVVQEELRRWPSSLTPDVVNVVALAPENLSVRELYDFIGYLKDNGLESTRYEVAMWVRIAAPFATACMILMALPFIFGSLRSVGVGQRVMVGALIGIGFYLFNGVFSRVALVFELPPVLSALLPTMLVFGVWIWLMRRVV